MKANKTQKNRLIMFSDWIFMAMLLAIVGITPLVVHISIRPMPPETMQFFNGMASYGDAFSYWKRWFLMVPAVIIILNFIGQIVYTRLRRIQQMPLDFKAIFTNPPVIAASAYLLFVLLSCIFSDYRFTALHGTYERNEGLYAQAAYITLFITALYYLRSPKYARILLFGLIFSSLLMGTVGFFQLLQHDFFTTKLASWLVMGDSTRALNPIFNTAYSTLHNPNTFGLYTAMIAPLLLIVGLAYDGKKWIKALFLLAGILMLVGVVGSASLGGMAGISAAAAAVALTYICNLIANKKKPSSKLGGAVAVALVCLLAAYIWIGPINAGINRAWERLLITVKSEHPVPPLYVFEDGKLKVTDAEGEAFFTFAVNEGENWITIYDTDGRPAATELYHMDQDEYPFFINITNETVDEHFSVRYRKSSVILQGLYLLLQNGRLVPYMPNGTPEWAPIDMDTPVPSWGFEGNEQWGSNRGYIWSRSFPLLPKYAIIGSGSDSFINVFPQHDVVPKLRFYANPYIIVDKAHSLYLQTWITTGGISFLALLFLLVFYLVTTFISLIRNKGGVTFAYSLRLGLLAAVSAFSVSSLATDSTISTTAVLYVLLGLGYAANAWRPDEAPNQN